MTNEEFEKLIEFDIEYRFTQIKNQYLNPQIVRSNFKTEEEFQEYIKNLHSKTLDEIYNELYYEYYNYEGGENSNTCFD